MDEACSFQRDTAGNPCFSLFEENDVVVLPIGRYVQTVGLAIDFEVEFWKIGQLQCGERFVGRQRSARNVDLLFIRAVIDVELNIVFKNRTEL